MNLRKSIASILLGVGIAATGVTSAAGVTVTWGPDPDCTYRYTRHAGNDGVLIDRRGNYRVYADNGLQRATATTTACDSTPWIRAMTTFRCQRYDARTERWVGTPCAARGILYLYEGYDLPPKEGPFNFTAAQTGSDGLITQYGVWTDYGCLYYQYESMVRVDSLTIGGTTWTNMLRDGSNRLGWCG